MLVPPFADGPAFAVAELLAVAPPDVAAASVELFEP
jgi:hypothetical protein